MDRLEAMSILVAAAEAGSLSAASRMLSVPLPTVSRKIAELEAHLNTRVLIRTTRKLTVTDAGVAYIAACKRILEQVNDAEYSASGEYSEPKGDLVIAAPIVFGRLHVLPVIAEFLAAYPEINVRLVLSDRNAHLIDDHIDAALRIGPLPDSSLVSTRLGSVRRVVCGSPNYFKTHGVPKIPADLLPLAAVTFDTIGSSESWTFRVPGSKADFDVPVHSRLSVNTAEAAADAAVAGIGVTRVLSYQVADRVADGVLQIVLSSFEPEPLPVRLVHAGRALQPLKLRAFLDFTGQRLQKRLAGKATRRQSGG
jgi:DNA-binding transcriptional LysR family regulator